VFTDVLGGDNVWGGKVRPGEGGGQVGGQSNALLKFGGLHPGEHPRRRKESYR